MKSANAPHLALFLLGSPYIERNGSPIRVEHHKAIAILAYLAVNAENHRHDVLAAFFWPLKADP